MRRPIRGGRVLFERLSEDASAVRYRVVLYVPDAEWEGEVRFALPDMGAEYSAWKGDGTPPAWLVDMCRAFGITITAARKKESPPRWPRRVHRWRAPKAES